MLSRLVLNCWPQTVLPLWLPKVLGLQVIFNCENPKNFLGSQKEKSDLLKSCVKLEFTISLKN